MTGESLNNRFEIPIGEIEDRIKCALNGDLSGYTKVVSPRDLSEVHHLSYLRKDVFYGLIKNIPLRGSSTAPVYPYLDSKIEMYGIEPKGLLVGQNFALDRKLIELMTGLEGRLFSGFLVKGISKMPPVQIYGLDNHGEKALSFYIPPIIEVHDNKSVLIDGIHRSKLCGSAGTTINGIHIRGIAAPLPFEPIDWEDCKIVSEKPPKEKRYRNLRMEYFRDLTAMGIDG